MARCNSCNKFMLFKRNSGYCESCGITIAKAEEERQRKAEEERQRKAEEERQRKAEEERQRKAEEERQRKAEEERQRKAEEERQRKAEEERQRKAEEERQRKAEEERQRKAEEERQRKAEEERQRKAEEERQRSNACTNCESELNALTEQSNEAVRKAREYLSIIYEITKNVFSAICSDFELSYRVSMHSIDSYAQLKAYFDHYFSALISSVDAICNPTSTQATKWVAELLGEGQVVNNDFTITVDLKSKAIPDAIAICAAIDEYLYKTPQITWTTLQLTQLFLAVVVSISGRIQLAYINTIDSSSVGVVNEYTALLSRYFSEQSERVTGQRVEVTTTSAKISRDENKAVETVTVEEHQKAVTDVPLTKEARRELNRTSASDHENGLSLARKPNRRFGNGHFDFGHANAEQRKAIEAINGPVLITAGPGTGKTYTLVQRAAYMIQECGVLPEEIMLVTFTEKAAKELITRISNELAARSIAVDINKMYIGTFHSICLRIIKEHPTYARISDGFRVLDGFEQQYVVHQHIKKFRAIPGFNDAVGAGSVWDQSAAICLLVNNLAEEMVDLDVLQSDSNQYMSLIAEIKTVYQQILDNEHLIDFSAIQVDTYNLLINDASALAEIREQIKYIMVDEYQDTNYIQEQIVFLLGGDEQNICVVGDDDQGLYRFRGATIRNILEFPDKFPRGKCKVVSLVTNYRSNSDIVEFYNSWMASPQVDWGVFRFKKTIKPYRGSLPHTPAVVKLSVACGYREYEPWCKKVYSFLKQLKASGQISNFNQVAFLFRSVRSIPVVQLADYLERHGIQVYSPRANMFFQRDEIQLAIGSLMLLFPFYVAKFEKLEYGFLGGEVSAYYQKCLRKTKSFLSSADGKGLSEWIRHKGTQIACLTSKASYGLKGLVYQLFAYDPFQHYVDANVDSGMVSTRPQRNLSILCQMIDRYEYQHYVEHLNPESLERDIELLFNQFIKLLYEQGIDEYEDESEYAPSDCVSFLTIHQAKGLEFPVVFVGSLSDYMPDPEGPVGFAQECIKYVATHHYKRSPFEPADKTKQFDLWRLYYTAFSRAQDLLILSCAEQTSRWHGRYSPSACFAPYFDYLPQADTTLDLSEFSFSEVKDVNLKDTFSFTSHVAIYNQCPRMYKLTNVLAFEQQKSAGMLFGQLIHMTIEQINRAAYEKRYSEITIGSVKQWLSINYEALKESKHLFLTEKQLAVALYQVSEYIEQFKHNWEHVWGVEYRVSMVNKDYIAEGAIDLIMDEDGKIAIYDFKTGNKEKVINNKSMYEQYCQQLYIYATLLEEQSGRNVKSLYLYFIGDTNGDPILTIPYTNELGRTAMLAFDRTVHRILKKEFSESSCSPEACQECDFRYYCHKSALIQ